MERIIALVWTEESDSKKVVARVIVPQKAQGATEEQLGILEDALFLAFGYESWYFGRGKTAEDAIADAIGESETPTEEETARSRCFPCEVLDGMPPGECICSPPTIWDEETGRYIPVSDT